MRNGRRYSHDYKRNGTTTLFAALEVATGRVTTGYYHRWPRVDFLDFTNGILHAHPCKEITVVLDNLSSHKPKRDHWLASHKNVHFPFTPTRASWLNQIEAWFSILKRRALQNGSFTSPRQLRDTIDRFVGPYNPFELTETTVRRRSLASSSLICTSTY